MFTYPLILKNLLYATKLYKGKEISLENYKQDIWSAVSEIVSLEDKDLRTFLQQAEAELDSIQFTVDDDKLFESTLSVVNKIEQRLTSYLNTTH